MRLKAYGNRDEMPAEWEQDVAEAYVNNRTLVRPNASVKKALIYVFIFILVTCLITWFLHFVLFSSGIFTHLPYGMQNFYRAYPILLILILCAAVIVIELVFCMKYAVIGAVRLYQRYAPEDIRRRCLFMPTCSEYTIMAVQKYGVIIGLGKSYIRLFYRCSGNIYMIDYP